MAVQNEIWQPVIMEALFQELGFLNHMYNADQYVIGGRAVHIPQSGGPANIEINRATVPAAAVERTDTDILYLLEEATSDPILIRHRDTVELSYDKMGSVVRENQSAIMDRLGRRVLYKAAENTPTAGMIPTTGVAAGATLPGATGDRKIVTEKDFRTAALYLNNQKVPKSERYCIMPDNMVDQLFDDDKIRDRFHKVVDLKDYMVGKLAGFTIIPIPSVLMVSAVQAIKAENAAVATDDSEGAIFYQKDFIERAIGDVKLFENVGDPQYYGDIYSMLVRLGCRARRQDNKGYGVIYQDAA